MSVECYKDECKYHAAHVNPEIGPYCWAPEADEQWWPPCMVQDGEPFKI